MPGRERLKFSYGPDKICIISLLSPYSRLGSSLHSPKFVNNIGLQNKPDAEKIG